jgi:hypothetical protein
MDFAEFVKVSEKIASDMLLSTGHVRPVAYVADEYHKITIVIMMVPKPLWKPLLTQVVKELHAIYYAFVDEAWYAPRIAYIPGESLEHHPLRREMLHIFSYSKDGQTNATIKPFKRLSSEIVQFEELPDELKSTTVHCVDNLIGNVF